MNQTSVKARIVKAINEQINEYIQRADILTMGYEQSFKDLPEDIKRRHENIGNIVEGLQEAVCIIMKCDCDVKSGVR